MALHQIPPQWKKWEQDYYAVTSMEFNDQTGQAIIDQHLTNTFKFASFRAGAQAIFYGGNKEQLGTQSVELECPPGGIFGGAGHAQQPWHMQAPPGTEGFALVQYYHPEGLAAVGEAVGTFFVDIGTAIADGVQTAEKWCDANPQACGLISMAFFVIAGTALCVALGPEICVLEVVIVIS